MRYAPDPHVGADERLERVVRSLQGLAAAVPHVRFPGCHQRLSCDVVENDGGAEVRLRTEDTSAEAVLRIDRAGATLRTVSRPRPGSEVATIVEDQYSVHLDDELRWGETVFRSSDVLASRLLEHAARRVSMLAEGRSEAPPPPRRTPEAVWAAGMLHDRLYGWTRGMPSMRTRTPLRPPRMRDG